MLKCIISCPWVNIYGLKKKLVNHIKSIFLKFHENVHRKYYIWIFHPQYIVHFASAEHAGK